METSVTVKDILLGLKRIGIEQDDKLIVHSSLSSFGYVDGGALSVISALQQAVGTCGVLLMPTFTYGQEPFDIKHTVSRTGIITEVFRLSPGVIRSEHPGFSVAIWGLQAPEFVTGHNTEVGIGKGTPLHRMIELGAKVLLIGVDHGANSILHLAQDLAQVPYLNRYRKAEVIDADGNYRSFSIRRAGCSLGFNKIQPFIDQAGIESRTMIGRSLVRILPAALLLDIAVELLHHDAGFLLCDRDECPSCSEAREIMASVKPR